MSEPGISQLHNADSLERGPDVVLGAARPLPAAQDAIIEDLTEDEDRLFLAAIHQA